MWSFAKNEFSTKFSSFYGHFSVQVQYLWGGGGRSPKVMVGYGNRTLGPDLGVRTSVSGPGCPDFVTWPRVVRSTWNHFHSVSHLFLPLFCPPSFSCNLPFGFRWSLSPNFPSFLPLIPFKVDLFPLNFYHWVFSLPALLLAILCPVRVRVRLLTFCSSMGDIILKLLPRVTWVPIIFPRIL